mmetsp:Transcript_11167/g.29206  ORF Transcript_11167/g.29206 Transcript_11167/m.29206 type:complete len:338 (-) Transcript_11167:160-1173(-)
MRAGASHAGASRVRGLTRMSIETITIRRGPGGLGLELSDANLVVSQSGQPELRIGDIVVAVDGVELAGKYLGSVIDQAAGEYVFTVSREPKASAAALEMALRGLGADLYSPNLDDVDAAPTPAVRARVMAVLGALEALGTQVAPADANTERLGFWKLLLGEGAVVNDGFSGMCAMPGVELIAQWQCFGEGEGMPQLQTVEIVADPLLGRYCVATLKGTFESEASGECVSVDAERYSRLVLDGAPQSSNPRTFSRTCTYLSASLRIVRPADREKEFCAYWRTSPQAATAEIGQLADKPIRSSGGVGRRVDEDDSMPMWQQRQMEVDDENINQVESGIP